ncbi:MAG: hypothetical protein JO076_12385 [Verrucomicrobia bacterium]|nr:hypothetical protein [Verrucomicrobiota bacterium]
MTIIGIYGYGPTTDQFWLNNPSNKQITEIALRTGGRTYSLNQKRSAINHLFRVARGRCDEPLLLFGYSLGACQILDIARILTRVLPTRPPLYLIGIDPVCLIGELIVPKGVTRYTCWYQENGGGRTLRKLASLRFSTLDGTPFRGPGGKSIKVTDDPQTKLPVSHAAMPFFVREQAVAEITQLAGDPEK